MPSRSESVVFQRCLIQEVSQRHVGPDYPTLTADYHERIV